VYNLIKDGSLKIWS